MDCLDPALDDVEAHHAEELVLAVERHCTRLTVDLGKLETHASAAQRGDPGGDDLGHLLVAEDWLALGRHLASAVGMQGDIFCQQRFQRRQVSQLRGSEKAPGKLLLLPLGRGVTRTLLAHLGTRPGDQMPGAVDAGADDLGNFCIGIFEDFT